MQMAVQQQSVCRRPWQHGRGQCAASRRPAAY